MIIPNEALYQSVCDYYISQSDYVGQAKGAAQKNFTEDKN